MATHYPQKKRPANKQPVIQKKKPQPVVQEPPRSSKKGFYILLALLGGLILFVFHDFLFLNNVFLYKDIGSDSINAGLPQLFHISDYFHNLGGIPKWSFYQGMGQNYLGYLSGDPFDLLLYFANPSNTAYLMGIMEALKMLVAGLFFYLFLRELHLTPYTAIIGAMCYAFCGWIVLGSCWHQYSSDVYQTAFLLLAIEKLLHGKWYYFPFAIALIGITTSFHLFFSSVITGVYTFIRLYSQYGLTKKIGTTYGQLIGLGILGVGISAFISMNKFQLMLDSPRVSGEVSFFSQLMSTPVFQTDGFLDNLTKIGRLFSNDMLGTGNFFVGAENYMEAPTFYAGLLSLLLFTQFFPFLSKRKKWIVTIIFICALLPFIFPWFRYMFWLFSGRYYRYLSFLFGVVLLVFAMLSMHHVEVTRKINFKILFGAFFGLLILLYFPNIMGVKHPYQANLPLFQSGIQSFCWVFLLFYTLLISLFSVKSAVRYVKPVLVGLVFIELAFMANTTINHRDLLSYGEVKGKTGFNDYSVDAVQYLQRMDTSFFRVQKTYGSGPAMHKSLNDPLIQRFYGTASYSSFNQRNYVDFLMNVVLPEDANEYATRWLEGLTVDRPLLQIFGNVHYNLSKTPLPPQALLLNDSINTVGDVHIYKHKFTLPFGYTYSHYMPRHAFDSLPFKDVALLKAVIVADTDTAKYAALQPFSTSRLPGNYLLDDLAADTDSLKKEAFHITYFSQNNIKGDITVRNDKLLFFTIPFDKDWKAFDNGKEIAMEQVNIGFSGVLLAAGDHNIELRFAPALFSLSCIISWGSLLLTAALIGWCWWRKRKK
ncbi:MAG: YfhO family protein [Prevotellaceae bacterium]|jgi:uncharacterized membrane protein YfhO|nr:YfhO family protein [Prevotellaceae bacterium]